MKKLLFGCIFLLTFTPIMEYNPLQWLDNYSLVEARRIVSAGEVIYQEAIERVGQRRALSYLNHQMLVNFRHPGIDSDWDMKRLKVALVRLNYDSEIQLSREESRTVVQAYPSYVVRERCETNRARPFLP